MRQMWEKRSVRKVWGPVAAVMATLALLMLSAGTSIAARDLKIGVIAPMSGGSAETGDSMKKASVLATKEINAKGGINGRKVELVFGDDQSNAAAGASAVERMIIKDKVDIVIGSLNSDVALAIMEVAANYKVPMILTCPAAYKIAETIAGNPKRYALTIKTDPSTQGYGVTLANFLTYIKDNKATSFKKKTAVLLTEHTEYGRSIVDAAKKELGKIGWKVLANEVHPHGESNFMALISKIKALNPDILVTAETSAASASAIAKQFLEQNLQMWLLQAYGPFLPGYVEALGGKGDGIVAMSLVKGHTKEFEQFSAKFRKEFGNEKFEVCGGMQYDMMMMTKEAYEKAGSFDNEKFMNAFLTTKKNGTVGTYVMDPQSHESKVGIGFIPPVVMQLQQGKFRYIMPASPDTTLSKPTWIK